MARFFAEWELWLKLVFLLACAIVITITAGYTKVTITNYRLKRQTIKVQSDSDEERVWPNGRHREETSGTKNASLPFGAVALQTGIEIEGIWTPHSHTPETSSESLSEPRVPQDSAVSEAALTTSLSTEKPKLVINQPSKVIPVSGRVAHKPAAEEDVATLSNQHPTELTTGHYSLFMLQNPQYAQAMAEIEAEYQASRSIDLESLATSHHNMNRPSKSNNQHIMRTRQTFAPDIARVPLHRHSDDLSSMLDRQRNGQAAETGQLTPRKRRGHSNPPGVGFRHGDRSG